VTERPARTRVLICEDSRTYAAALARTLEHGGEIDVVGVRTTAEAAIADLAQLEPDLITMDIELPGISGLEAVEQIMSMRPTPILVLSGRVGNDGAAAAAALAAGALEAIGKDDLPLRDPAGPAAAAFRRRVLLLSRARVIRHPRARLGARPPVTAPADRAVSAGAAIGICASTGGPQALAALLAAVPAAYPIPILVVQHITAGFTEGLVKWLGGSLPLPVRLPEHGDRLEAGVTVAPDGADLILRRDGTLALDRTSPAGLHRPSADVLLRSLADAAGTSAVAVVLTGMGRDGAEGLAAVRQAGGLTIAQDEATSAVYGMPKEAAKRGAELILPLEQIAGALAALSVERRRRPS
jgi:two-component system chemotaxis response regulator CheB